MLLDRALIKYWWVSINFKTTKCLKELKTRSWWRQHFKKTWWRLWLEGGPHYLWNSKQKMPEVRRIFYQWKRHLNENYDEFFRNFRPNGQIFPRVRKSDVKFRKIHDFLIRMILMGFKIVRVPLYVLNTVWKVHIGTNQD